MIPREENTAAQPSTALTDEATQVLLLAADLHAARGDAAAWREALAACGDWLGCTGLLQFTADDTAFGPDDLEAIAGRLTHCAGYGVGACGCGNLDGRKRQRCAALAPHFHQAANASRNAVQASLFDHLPPTWILDREARVRDANAGARALTQAGDRFAVADGVLGAAAPGGMPPLRRALAQFTVEARHCWIDAQGEATLLLRELAEGGGIAATLMPEPPRGKEIASALADHFDLTARQGELAAHLQAGHTLLDAARAMGISRHTANEHLAAVLRRTGAADRKALLAQFRRALHR